MLEIERITEKYSRKYRDGFRYIIKTNGGYLYFTKKALEELKQEIEKVLINKCTIK